MSRTFAAGGTALKRFLEGAYLGQTVTAFCVALIVLIWIGVAAGLVYDHERTLRNVTRTNENLVRSFEQHVIRTVSNADQTLRTIKAQYEKSGEKFDLAQFERDGLLSLQPFNILSIVNEHGDLIKASRPFTPVNLSDRPYFQRHSRQDSDRLEISKPLLGRTTGKWSIFLTRRLNKKDGSFGGMAVIAMDPEYFSGFYDQIDLGPRGVVTLVGRDGDIRARKSDRAAPIDVNISDSKLLAQLVPASNQGSYVDTSRIDGVTRVFSYRALHDYSLVMVVGTAEATVLEGYRGRKAVYLWSAGTVSALILLFVALLRVQLSRQARAARHLLDAQDALARSEMHLRAIVDHAAVGIARVSLDARWLQVNPALCEFLGYTQQEMLERSVAEVTDPAHIDANLERIGGALAGRGDEFSLRKRYLRKDGAPVWADTTVTLVRNADGNPEYFIGVIADLNAQVAAETEAGNLRRELEERVEQRTAELAEAVKGLESFSYSVSHDLRTPLRAISGFAQILARRHRERLDEQGRHYMDNIVRASAQMGRLIEDLLNYSRLGRKVVRMDRVALQEVIADVTHVLQPRIAESAAELRVPADLPPVEGDPTLLEQIFLNLVDNALTYRKPGRAPVIELSWMIDGDDVIASVRDNGIGIAPEHFDTIFGVFQRLHSEDQYPGTGIGLATVKRAAEMLGGKIWVESSVGVGSAFHVRLRRAGDA